MSKPAPAASRDLVEAEALARITPDAAEQARVQGIASRLTEKATAAMAKANLAGRAEVQGSVAKGTWLRGGADVDLFLLLDPNVPADRLEGAATDVGKQVLESPQKRYAQHPYLQGRFEGLAVDLVPAYAVAAASARMTAVDRTPFHTAWVRSNLSESQRADVRLAKRWLKGVGAYGADTATGGFSGYLVEILVAARKSWDGALHWLAAGAQPRRIALGPDEAGEVEAPLVVVDPVDPARNCAAAVTQQVLDTAIEAAQAYLASPSLEFFFPAPPRAEPAANLEAALAARGEAWLGIALAARTDRLDIVLPQFHRAARSLAERLAEAGFEPRRHAVHVHGQDVLMQWVVAGSPRPATKRHDGPQADLQPNADRFRGKWAGHPDALGPVRVGANGKLEVEVRNHVRAPADVAALPATAQAVGRHVQAAWGDRRTWTAPGEAAAEWQPEVADLVLDRRPWQR